MGNLHTLSIVICSSLATMEHVAIVHMFINMTDLRIEANQENIDS